MQHVVYSWNHVMVVAARIWNEKSRRIETKKTTKLGKCWTLLTVVKYAQTASAKASYRIRLMTMSPTRRRRPLARMADMALKYAIALWFLRMHTTSDRPKLQSISSDKMHFALPLALSTKDKGGFRVPVNVWNSKVASKYFVRFLNVLCCQLMSTSSLLPAKNDAVKPIFDQRPQIEKSSKQPQPQRAHTKAIS